MKHAANRRINPRPRSTCPTSNAPAFDVIAAPSNPATTERRSTASNANSLGVHSACIGVHLSPRQIVVAQHFSLILSPDALPRLRNPRAPARGRRSAPERAEAVVHADLGRVDAVERMAEAERPAAHRGAGGEV